MPNFNLPPKTPTSKLGVTGGLKADKAAAGGNKAAEKEGGKAEALASQGEASFSNAADKLRGEAGMGPGGKLEGGIQGMPPQINPKHGNNIIP